MAKAIWQYQCLWLTRSQRRIWIYVLRSAQAARLSMGLSQSRMTSGTLKARRRGPAGTGGGGCAAWQAGRGRGRGPARLDACRVAADRLGGGDRLVEAF